MQRRQATLRHLAMQIDDPRTPHLRFSLQGALLNLNAAAEALLGRGQSRAMSLHLSGDWLATLRRDGWIEFTARATTAPLMLVLLCEDSAGVTTAVAAQDVPTEALDESLLSFIQVARKSAHDFNNILATVTGYAELAVMLSNEPRIKQYLSEIHSGGKRGQALVKEFQMRLLQGDLAQSVMPTESHGLPDDTGKHVLVVDDDVGVADLLSEMLRMSGYRVTTCYTAREALRNVQQDMSIGLLLTDQTMPEMTGTQLIGKATQLRPGLPHIVCTGWGDTIASSHDGESAVRNLIAKPVESDALLALVRKLLRLDALQTGG